MEIKRFRRAESQFFFFEIGFLILVSLPFTGMDIRLKQSLIGRIITCIKKIPFLVSQNSIKIAKHTFSTVIAKFATVDLSRISCFFFLYIYINLVFLNQYQTTTTRSAFMLILTAPARYATTYVPCCYQGVKNQCTLSLFRYVLVSSYLWLSLSLLLSRSIWLFIKIKSYIITN